MDRYQVDLPSENVTDFGKSIAIILLHFEDGTRKTKKIIFFFLFISCTVGQKDIQGTISSLRDLF